MKVALYSRTPLAAAPLEIWKALERYGVGIETSLINRTLGYRDGRRFPGHLLASNADAARALKGADLWHVHNYWDREPLDALLARYGRPVVAQFHSVPRLGNWAELQSKAKISYTIRQPLQAREYAPFMTMPNLVDADERRPARRSMEGPVRIAFAPSTQAPVGHPASKGRAEVLAILKTVAAERAVEVVLIEGVPYEENLKLKRSAHILVDDVVTGNWHRTSLEGACFACAVLNAARQQGAAWPWVHATLASLRAKLLQLIDDRPLLIRVQEMTRAWILGSEFHALEGVKEYVKAYQEVLSA